MPPPPALSPWMRALARPVLGILPHTCLVCRSWSQGALCEPCLLRFAGTRSRCATCAAPMPQAHTRCGACLRRQPAFERTVTAVDYGLPWDRLVARMKFRDQPRLAVPLAGLLAGAVRFRQREHGNDDGDGEPALPSLVLPIPLTIQRLRERGYNQAWELARRVAADLALKADAGVLLRLHETPHQVGLDRTQRTANLRGAFAVEPRRRRELAGTTVALVDDVMTTGATLDEAARTLRQAGAQAVLCWVFARTA